jgi:hypothetical protein
MKPRVGSKQEAVKLEVEGEPTGVLRSARIIRGKWQGSALLTASAKSEDSLLVPKTGMFCYTKASPILTFTSETTSNTPKKRKRSPSPANTPSKSSPRKPKVYKMELDAPHPPPANWRVTYDAIEEMRKEKAAPVDTMGCHVPMLDARIDQRVSLL